MAKKEKPRFMFSGMWERFRCAELPISVKYVEYDEKTVHDAHYHDFPQVWYCKEGFYHHFLGELIFDCGPGSLVIVPAGIKHGLYIPESCKLYQIDVLYNIFGGKSKWDSINAAAHLFLFAYREVKFKRVLITTFRDELRDFVEERLDTLVRHTSNPSAKSLDVCRDALFAIFNAPNFSIEEKRIKYIKRFAKNKLIPVLRSMYYMNKNYAKKINREELLEMTGLCQTEYFRLIKRTCGETFSSYLQLLRVRHAIVLATFSPYSLSYIADVCGFGDLTYMENRIKKFHPDATLPSEMKKNRDKFIKAYPNMIMSREEYEKLPKFFDLPTYNSK